MSCSMSRGSSASGSMFGPSLSARSGSGCVSQKTASHPAGDGRPGQKRDHLALTAGRGSARKLNAVRGVEDDRRSETLHDGDRPHIVDQPAVAERRSPLGEQDISISGLHAFFHDVNRVFRRDELGLFDVDHAVVAGGRHSRRMDEIGLPRQKGRDLDDVAANFWRLVRPGCSRGCQSSRAAQWPDEPARGSPTPFPAPVRRKLWMLVRFAFVETRFEHDGNVEISLGNFRQPFRKLRGPGSRFR